MLGLCLEHFAAAMPQSWRSSGVGWEPRGAQGRDWEPWERELVGKAAPNPLELWYLVQSITLTPRPGAGPDSLEGCEYMGYTWVQV